MLEKLLKDKEIKKAVDELTDDDKAAAVAMYPDESEEHAHIAFATLSEERRRMELAKLKKI